MIRRSDDEVSFVSLLSPCLPNVLQANDICDRNLISIDIVRHSQGKLR